MNKVFLSGNLTKDPELKYTQKGKAYARVGIAVKRLFDKDATDFFNLVAFDKTAEFLTRYFLKGSRIFVEGRLQTSSYEKNGVKVNATDIFVDQIEFAGGKKDDNPKSNTKPADEFDGEPIDPNDTPF